VFGTLWLLAQINVLTTLALAINTFAKSTVIVQQCKIVNIPEERANLGN
jgi:hypothetical protein